MDLNLNEVDSLVHQWLLNEGYHDVATVLQEEADLKIQGSKIPGNEVNKIKTAILDGDWVEVEKLCIKYSFKNHKSFLYAIYKQGYLELLEKQEYQKAFAYLTKLLKPLENRQPDPEDFRDLCYLLTCKSVQDASSFKNWEGGKEGRSREKLVEQFESLLNVDNSNSSNTSTSVNTHRLTDLLSQAVAYQVEITNNHTNKVTPKINTLLEDYKSIKLPYNKYVVYKGHKDNVKCVQFIEQTENTFLVTGSSDNTLKIWDINSGDCISTLTGHSSRIWDVTTNKSGKLLVSASGDSTVKLWSISDTTAVECIQTLKGHEGDVYTVQFHPGQNHIVSGGYDKIIRLFDVRNSMLKKSFVGHNSSISSAIFNPLGNLIISGSKDNTIKIWDIGSGLCIRTISSHLGEVTSIDINSSGSLLLSSSKDNANRLWDLRSAKPVRKFKGHQNTSKNFIRACFGPEERLILGGSEDGAIYIWDLETGNILQKIEGHSDLVYAVTSKKNLLASCSHDNTAATWQLSQ